MLLLHFSQILPDQNPAKLEHVIPEVLIEFPKRLVDL
jgi:hypothetical protein